jgi:hypothetical protein
LVPSLYKTSVVYAERPLDANGQLTFTRASEATRVGPDGYVEKVRTNLILQSQTFNNASWTPVSTTVTANAETAPDGTLTAETMTIVDSNSRITQSISLGAGTYTISCFVKTTSTTTAGDLRFAPVVDASNSNSFFTATSDWQRYSFTFTAATSVTSIAIRGAASGFVGTIAIWGFQAEVSDFGATDYIPTTTTAVSVGPVSNLPRLDYPINADGSVGCPRLLLEPQRTNLLRFSEQINISTVWEPIDTTVTANTQISPDGYQNADVMALSASTSRVFQALSLGAGTYTASVYAKKISGSGDVQIRMVVDGANSTFSFTPTDQWVRYSYTFTAVTGVTFYQLRSTDYNGNVAFWGAQLEVGAYATSYIPTLGSSITRVADAASKTGISSLIGQTEGTVFVEFNNRLLASYPNEYIVQIISGTTQLWLRKEQGVASFTARLIVSGSTIWTFASSIVPINGNNKIAIAYKTGDSAVFLNGAQVSSTNTSAFSGSAFADLNFNFSGTLNPELPLSQALLFKTRLTNAQMQELTSL